MRTSKQGIERRAVIEAYARYDCNKTGRTLPEFSTWDWSEANAIDASMCLARLKVGVPAGYLLWDKVELTISDFCECAIVAGVFPGQSRKLGDLENDGALVNWKPDRRTVWYESVLAGRTFDETAPLLLRPGVRGESPARWYLEDGSGRGIAFVANKQRFDPSQTLAIGYLGVVPDRSSVFMQRHFQELLRIGTHDFS